MPEASSSFCMPSRRKKRSRNRGNPPPVQMSNENDEDSKPSLDFKNLVLDSFEPLEELENRTVCTQCGNSRKYFCYDCLIPLTKTTPNVKLPVHFHVVRYPKEHQSKSSALPTKLLAPDHVSLHVHPETPEFDPNDTVILFPSKDAKAVDEVDWNQYKNVVVVDSTWSQTHPMMKHKSVKFLPSVKLENRRTAFWRHQKHGDQFLSSVEAMYFLLLEHFAAVENVSYNGCYDNLLWYFSFMHKLITKSYRESGMNFPRKKKWLQPVENDENEQPVKNNQTEPENENCQFDSHEQNANNDDHVPVDQTGIVKDKCENEQTAILKKYVLNASTPAGADSNETQWSANGELSLSPFCPCAATRIPHVFSAIRLTKFDVLYDLGCGDGRVLLEAAARYGCQVVGIEIDENCIEMCHENAKKWGLQDRCTWILADMATFRDDFFEDPAASFSDEMVNEIMAANMHGKPPGMHLVPPPTVVLIFITGHGLVSISAWLKKAWKIAGEVRLVTCVEALDTARDYREDIFADANPNDWKVFRDPVASQFGVFLVPPDFLTVEQWGEMRQPPLDLKACRPWVEISAVHIERGLLNQADIDLLLSLSNEYFSNERNNILHGENNNQNHEDFDVTNNLFNSDEPWVGGEDQYHNLSSHRIVHLHRESDPNNFGKLLDEIRAKLLRLLFRVDFERYELLKNRPVFVRSFEYHHYTAGGSVIDPNHRDDGSLLTISVLIDRSVKGYGTEDCEGGIFGVRIHDHDEDPDAIGEWALFSDMQPGDAAVFVSERRHNVTPIVQGTRDALVMELWDGGINTHNRHR